MSREGQVRLWVESSLAALLFLWEQKLDWLFSLANLSHVTLTGQERAQKLVLEGGEIQRRLNIPAPSDPEFQAFMNACRVSAQTILRREFWNRGRYKIPTPSFLRDDVVDPMWVMDVEGVKDWLNELGPGVRYRS